MYVAITKLLGIILYEAYILHDEITNLNLQHTYVRTYVLSFNCFFLLKQFSRLRS